MKNEKNHKFKKGDKFVIEIAECHTHWADDGYPMSLYRIKGFASLVFDDKGLTRLLEQQKETSNQLIESLKPRTSNETPKEIICNCTKE